MMGRRVMLGAGAALATGAHAQTAKPASMVEPPCGPVVGRLWLSVGQPSTTDYPLLRQQLECLGIPYAAPPIGPLRDATPKPHPVWTTPR